jgi:peptidoglycan/xylan/chitin deacetylase (PgdA/CDA1 family)
VVYHYVRDRARSLFPALKAMDTAAFREQVDWLAGQFEWATLESALAFLKGTYCPKRSLCLLTFDDGLKEHYARVLPILDERGIQGVFFVITSSLNGQVASVHKNHFLMASLGFDAYQRAFRARVAETAPEAALDVDAAEAQRIYRWDTPEIAAFKYLFNFQLDKTIRNDALRALFEAHLGPEKDFAASLYLSWPEAREMQSVGMVIGGHSHSHPALGMLSPDAQRHDLEASTSDLRRALYPQAAWPFSYPYGDFNDVTVDTVRRLGYHCSFALGVGANSVGHDAFRLNRFDTNDVPAHLGQPLCH